MIHTSGCYGVPPTQLICPSWIAMPLRQLIYVYLKGVDGGGAEGVPGK